MLLCGGEFYLFSIRVGEEPYRDSATEENNKILEYAMRKPFGDVKFSGSFRGGGHDEDGYVVVEHGIATAKNIMTQYPIGVNGVFPLEVGYVSPERSLMYLNRGRYARWPYGSKDIYVIYHPLLGK
jgi:hypothetical protein